MTDMPQAKYTEYTELEPGLRYRQVTYQDPMDFGVCTDYVFERFKRPYFFGLLGKKKWDNVIQTNSYNIGYEFAKTL